MRRVRQPSDRGDSGEGWEDAVPPAVLAGAVDAVAVDPDAPRVSTMYAAAKLLGQGMTQVEAAAILGVDRSTIRRAIQDERYPMIQQRFLADSQGMEAARGAKMAYYCDRAYEVLHDELSSPNAWLAHGAAVALIAASKADESKGRRRIEVIMSPSMAYDDQEPDGAESEDMQEDVEDDAETLDSGINPAYIPHP